MIDVCVPCHLWLTARQRDVGMVTSRGPQPGGDDVRAAFVGVLLLLELFTRLHRLAFAVDGAMITRAASQALDLVEPPDRSSRWGADPIGAALRSRPPAPRPVNADPDVQSAKVRGVGDVVVELLCRFDPEPATGRLAGQLVARVEPLLTGWDAALADPAVARRVAASVGEGQRVVTEMAAHVVNHGVDASFVAWFLPRLEAAAVELMEVFAPI
jgi:hypothetical protein